MQCVTDKLSQFEDDIQLCGLPLTDSNENIGFLQY